VAVTRKARATRRKAKVLVAKARVVAIRKVRATKRKVKALAVKRKTVKALAAKKRMAKPLAAVTKKKQKALVAKAPAVEIKSNQALFAHFAD